MNRLCLFGAAPDTGNLGVSALCFGVLGALARRLPGVRITVFDHGRGVRNTFLPLKAGDLAYERCGAMDTRRYYRRESLWNIRVSSWLGGLGNAAAMRMRNAEAILDISGGDSFTDMYGARRWHSMTMPKQMSLELGRPLVLLPQTYGPYAGAAVKSEAARFVRGAAMAWARDSRSFNIMRELLGDAYDPARHQDGVDVAFLLEARAPKKLDDAVARVLSDRARPLAGINVSGLLFHDQDGGRAQFGLKADYREAVRLLVERVAAQAEVVLIPHVVTPPGHYESDIEACRAIALGMKGRVHVAPAFEDPSEVKWLIAQMDWFCGTRMHSTIAGLSSGVPTAAIAYSPKTQGVFESCGQGSHVADPRSLDTRELVEQLVGSWQQRKHAMETLRAHLPRTLERAESQMDMVAQLVSPSKARQQEVRA